jgi:hypothetical protein
VIYEPAERASRRKGLSDVWMASRYIHMLIDTVDAVAGNSNVLLTPLNATLHSTNAGGGGGGGGPGFGGGCEASVVRQ